jgi:hypothetical protein
VLIALSSNAIYTLNHSIKKDKTDKLLLPYWYSILGLGLLLFILGFFFIGGMTSLYLVTRFKSKK